MVQIIANLEIADRGEISIPTAASFQLKFCTDPTCGPHFLLIDREGKPFCEMIISQEQFFRASEEILDRFDANDRNKRR